MAQSYCSPSREKVYERDGTCFNRAALLRLVDAWNDKYPDEPIQGVTSKTKKQVWDLLNERMHRICKGNGREWCWVDQLNRAKDSPDVTKSLRPAKPREWYRHPYTWLTNYDIEAVMRQYQENKEYKFRFLGVYPIDFEGKTGYGTCLFTEICNLDIPSFSRRGYKYMGMITNLDRHDQPGSHWTALFMCLDPKLPSYGAYYYDSVANAPPPDMRRFMERVTSQMNAVSSSSSQPAEFKVQYNKHRHQYGNSECGVFSMAYLIRWLDAMHTKPQTTLFEDIVKPKISDKEVHKLRNKLFRPNTKEVVGGKKIAKKEHKDKAQ